MDAYNNAGQHAQATNVGHPVEFHQTLPIDLLMRIPTDRKLKRLSYQNALELRAE